MDLNYVNETKLQNKTYIQVAGIIVVFILFTSLSIRILFPRSGRRSKHPLTRVSDQLSERVYHFFPTSPSLIKIFPSDPER